MTVRILVTGAGALLGQGLIRSIATSSLDAFVISVDPSPLSAGLYWTGASHLVPMANDPAYLPRIREVISAEKPDVVLVGTDVELSIFAAHRDALEKEFATHVVVSSPEVVAIADDKFLTFEFLKKNGFAYPKSVLAQDTDAVAELVSDVGFPVIVKPCVGARSVGVHLVQNRTELDAALASGDGLVVQELAGADDQEFTAGVICFDGECRASIVMRRDLRDGNTYRAYVDQSAELNAAVQKMGEALAPFGPANFQFRTDDNGVPRVFEINGRFSGTTPLRVLAGFNEVEMCVRHLVEQRRVSQPVVTDKVFLRHWSETVLDASELMSSA